MTVWLPFINVTSSEFCYIRFGIAIAIDGRVRYFTTTHTVQAHVLVLYEYLLGRGSRYRVGTREYQLRIVVRTVDEQSFLGIHLDAQQAVN